MIHVLLAASLHRGIGHTLWARRDAELHKAPALEREMVMDVVRASDKKEPQDAREFVEVTASQATTEPPKTAKFYSERSSQAANPDTSKDSNRPKITGTQERIAKTTASSRAEVQPQAEPTRPLNSELQATAESQKRQPVAVEELRVAKADSKVDRLVPPTKVPTEVVRVEAKQTPVPELRRETVAPPSAPVRKPPRRLADVTRKSGASILAGEAMRQEGGVRRFGMESTLDVRSTEFGAYDAAIVAAIQKRWYDLLDDRNLPRGEVGKVVLQFRLHMDGRITDLREVESNVSGTLSWMCQRAVEEPAPYAAWPSDLKRLVGKDYREVRFVFYYN